MPQKTPMMKTQLNSNKYLQLEVTFLTARHLVYGLIQQQPKKIPDSNFLGRGRFRHLTKAMSQSRLEAPGFFGWCLETEKLMANRLILNG